MMYYRKALKLQAFLDMAEDEGLLRNSTIWFNVPFDNWKLNLGPINKARED